MNGWFRLRMRNPELRESPGATGTWFLSALQAPCLARIIRSHETKGLSPVGIIERLAPEIEEGTVLFLPSPGFPDPRVLAFKSVICSRDLFWAVTEKGGIVLSDRFADLLPELPPEECRLSDRRAIHFLMGCNLRGTGPWSKPSTVSVTGRCCFLRPGKGSPKRGGYRSFPGILPLGMKTSPWKSWKRPSTR